MRRIGLVLLIIVLACGGMIAVAASRPVVRHLDFHEAAWPIGAAPMRLVLLTDTHVSGPDSPPSRLRRIVATIDRLKPDVIMLGGDFVSDGKLVTRHYAPAAAIAPLGGLRARQGVFAVLGNHDHWVDAAGVRAALNAAHIRVLSNQAVRIGPLAIGGVDDDYTRRARVTRTALAMRRLGGVGVMLSHSPDVFAATPAGVRLVLAGHTHCGQITLPLVGPIETESRYGRRFACGVIRERGRTLVVSAGVGTSIVPFRLGARPDIWVIDLHR